MKKRHRMTMLLQLAHGPTHYQNRGYPLPPSDSPEEQRLVEAECSEDAARAEVTVSPNVIPTASSGLAIGSAIFILHKAPKTTFHSNQPKSDMHALINCGTPSIT